MSFPFSFPSFFHSNVSEWVDLALDSLLKWLQGHTYDWDNAYSNDVGYTERQQQHGNDRGSQLSDDEMEVNVANSIGIHLECNKVIFYFVLP